VEDNPLKSEQRRLRGEERVGRGGYCILCGEPDLKGLIPVKRTLLEKHHVVGKAHGRVCS
jgi:hypothetical protein